MKQVIVATVLALSTVLAHAQQTITIVWPFGMGDTQAQYSRSLVEGLNRDQKKYTFILENKPGAGATIGAKYVAATPNTILAASTAFFVRPNFYPEESHKVADFKPLMTQCAAPMVIVSKRYQSWKDIDPQAKINIGISGLGATSHLMALEIKKRYPNATPIPYKGTREASIDAANGNLDMSVAFIGEVEGLLDDKRLYALGLSGPNPVRGIPTLESQGFEGVKEIVNMHSLIVPKTMPDTQYDELRTLVLKAAKADSVQRAYQVDYCQPSNFTARPTVDWFYKQISMWKRLSQGVSIGNI
jgi:tripartite-type tricarboxylate transporter receptor subunit TctC